MAYSENFLPKEAAYYTLDNATITNGRLSIQAGGSAQLVIDQTRLSAITSTLLFNVYADRLLDPLSTSVIIYLDITLEDGTIEHVSVYPNQLNDVALSFPITLKDGAYTTCLLTIKAYVPCDLLVYEICAEQESDVTTIIDGVQQSLPHVLYDYNEGTITIEKNEDTVAMIACNLQNNTDVNGHFLMHFYSTEQCDVFLRFYDNEIEELYAPLKYTATPGYNSVGVPHAYLKRLTGIHTFIVTCQCTNGKLTMYTREILFTIDAGYLAERLIDVGMDICDLTVKQTSQAETPEELWCIGIDANETLVKCKNYNTSANTVWTPKYSMGPSLNAAIEFNGDWALRKGTARYTIITEDEPYIFIIEKDNTLVVYKGDDKSSRLVLDTSVTDLSVVRGYKSQLYPEQDQGLICAYIKNNEVYYRNYIYDINKETFYWHLPIKVDTEEQIKDIHVQRLNDYRIGFALTGVNNNYWFITTRTYVNQAAPADNAQIGMCSYWPCFSCTNYIPDINGTPITFEDPTEGQTEFYVEWNFPIKVRPDKDLEEVIVVTVNDIKYEYEDKKYTVRTEQNRLYITFTEEIIATRLKEAKVNISFAGRTMYLCTNDQGFKIVLEENQSWTWIIERKIVTTNIDVTEKPNINIALGNTTVEMIPIRYIKQSASDTVQSNMQVATVDIQPIVIKEIIQHYSDSVAINITFNNVNIAPTLVGTSPI